MSLTVQGLTKTYIGPDGVRVPVLHIPVLRLEDGEQVSLIGTSGSGKTTLLHVIAGILAPMRVRFASSSTASLSISPR